MGWARNTKSEPSASGVINTPPTPREMPGRPPTLAAIRISNG